MNSFPAGAGRSNLPDTSDGLAASRVKCDRLGWGASPIASFPFIRDDTCTIGGDGGGEVKGGWASA